MLGLSHFEVNNFRFPREGRSHFYAMLHFIRRVNAVEQDTRAHHIKFCFFAKLENRAGVGNMSKSRGGERMFLVKRKYLVETRKLQTRVTQVFRIRICKMGVDSLHIHIFAAQRGILQSVGVVIMNTDALHTGINFEMNDCFFAKSGGNRIDLPETFHRGGGQSKVVLNKLGNLLLPNATKNENGRADSRLTEQNTLFENSHADIVGVRGKIARNICHPVTIGVCLENNHHFGGRSFLPNGFKICTESIEIDFDTSRANCLHGRIIT